jgi:hypothetical protein
MLRSGQSVELDDAMVEFEVKLANLTRYKRFSKLNNFLAESGRHCQVTRRMSPHFLLLLADMIANEPFHAIYRDGIEM